MITIDKIVDKYGKKGAVDFVLKNRSSEKTLAERDRGIKGRVRFRMCEHGVWVIDNYEQKRCSSCHSEASVEFPSLIIHSKEYFNIGTGTFGTTQDHRKEAKRRGLSEAG